MAGRRRGRMLDAVLPRGKVVASAGDALFDLGGRARAMAGAEVHGRRWGLVGDMMIRGHQDGVGLRGPCGMCSCGHGVFFLSGGENLDGTALTESVAENTL